MEVRKILGRPIPTAHRVTIRDQVFAQALPMIPNPKTAKFIQKEYGLCGRNKQLR